MLAPRNRSEPVLAREDRGFYEHEAATWHLEEQNGRGGGRCPLFPAEDRFFRWKTGLFGASRAGIQALSGIAMRRPAASGRGSRACEFLRRFSRLETSALNGAAFFWSMSTCSDRFSDVADTHPSTA